MERRELIKRYGLFLIGLVLTSFGIALVTKAALGTSPVSSLAYTLSLILPGLSFGTWLILFCLVLIIAQILLLRSNLKKVELVLQIVVTFLFGYCVDASMFCLQWFNPETYILQIVTLLLGCFVAAVGAYFSVIANVVMLSVDAFIRAVAFVLHKDYGGVRVVFEVSMAAVSAAICIVFLHELVGVREGTIIAALITGNIVKVLMKWLQPLTNWLLPDKS